MGAPVRATRTRKTPRPTAAAAAAATALLLLLGACGPGDAPPAAGDDADQDTATATRTATPDRQEAFWDNMARQCGQAFAGRLVQNRPDSDMLAGDEELIAHWVRCEDDLMHVAFHVGRDGGAEWDRSRTWVLTRDDRGLELRHDHRLEDGSEDEGNTWYGGRTVDDGAPHTQWFLFDERRAPDGSVLGWRLEIEPGQRYVYGTIRGDDYTWRIDFDLSAPVPAPPPAWGHD
jgi:hypothetical protein